MTAALVLGVPELAVGLVMGLCYALLGMGLLLVYRTSRVVHFGYGEVGAFGALLLMTAVLDHGWSWWVACPLAVAAGALISAAWERTVIRRLFHAPRLVLLVATIGIGQLMFVGQLLVGSPSSNDLFPTPIDVHQPIGSFVLRGDHVVVLVAVPAIALALAWFLNRTVWGLAIRGSASNEDAAALAGVEVRRMSTLVWALAGALATITFVLVLPVRGGALGQGTQAVGAGLLLRALVVALAGRMQSLVATAVAGVALGIGESVLLANVSSDGVVDVVLFGVTLLILLLRGDRSEPPTTAASSWFREHGSVEGSFRWRRRLYPLAFAVALALPLLTSEPGRQFRLASVLVFALIAVSVTVITGWAGQVSLCQYSFVGLGALMTAALTGKGMGFGFALLYAMAAATAAAVLVGLPALRVRGLFLAAATLGFAVAANGWLFTRPVFQAADRKIVVHRPTWGPLDLADQRTYYYVCLAALVAVLALTSGLRRTGVGRSILAVRDNEAAASTLTVSPARVRLLAFALSGAIAGLAGGLYGGLYVTLAPSEFGPEQSFQVLAMTIIGGVTTITGAVLGAVYVVGLPLLLGDTPTVNLMTSGVGLLLLLMFTRGGLLEVLQRVARRVGGGAPPGDGPAPDIVLDAPTAAEAADTEHLLEQLPPVAHDGAEAPVVLECRAVDVRFAGLFATQGVDLELRRGETVGLIGTNGAGKSTLMNAICGLVPTSGGSVVVRGEDVTAWPTQERARLGIGRVFQEGALFPELTVRECVLVALEPRDPSELLPSLLWLPPALRGERFKRSVADDLIELTGLGPVSGRRVGELSTGTRRIVELTCILASGADILLLDEPTAGIAQREVEALGLVLREVQRELHASVLLVEHDMPLVMSLSDRIVCMAAGQVIAQGTPAEIRRDPEVIAAYLGHDERAIERSERPAGRRRPRTKELA